MFIAFEMLNNVLYIYNIFSFLKTSHFIKISGFKEDKSENFNFQKFSRTEYNGNQVLLLVKVCRILHLPKNQVFQDLLNVSMIMQLYKLILLA